MRTEDPVSTEPRTVTATPAARRDDPGNDVRRGAVDAVRRTESRSEADDRTPEEQGYGYGV